MAKFKKGDRVVCTKENTDVKIGATGTVDENDTSPFVMLDDISMSKWGHIKTSINEDVLELINNTMNDNDKVETTVANIKAAHAKGCSIGKAMIEPLYPKVFENDKIIFNPTKIYVTWGHGDKYRLVQEKDGWIFQDIKRYECGSQGYHSTAQNAINAEPSEEVKVFDTELEFAKWATS